MCSGQSKWVEEYKEVLIGSPQTFNCELVSLSDNEGVVIYRLQKEVVLENISMPPGTVSLGYFWTDRNYNLYHFLTSEGETLGFYFNVSDSTRLSKQQIYWRDLVVDILIAPDGRCRVLDEDEIPSDLSEELQHIIEQTRDYIVAHRAQLTNKIKHSSQQIMDSLAGC